MSAAQLPDPALRPLQSTQEGRLIVWFGQLKHTVSNACWPETHQTEKQRCKTHAIRCLFSGCLCVLQGGEDIGLEGDAGGMKWEGMGTSDF